MKFKESFFSPVLGILFFVIFFGCKNAPENSQSSSIQHVSTALSKEQAQSILSSYLDIKGALVQANGEDAAIAARDIADYLQENEDELAAKIRTDAESIAGTTDVDIQREHFNAFSENVYALVKATEANAETLYRQYCPMAFNNEGAYWLSDEKEIYNPYFGDKMLHCGKVKEVIKTNK